MINFKPYLTTQGIVQKKTGWCQCMDAERTPRHQLIGWPHVLNQNKIWAYSSNHEIPKKEKTDLLKAMSDHDQGVPFGCEDSK